MFLGSIRAPPQPCCFPSPKKPQQLQPSPTLPTFATLLRLKPFLRGSSYNIRFKGKLQIVAQPPSYRFTAKTSVSFPFSSFISYYSSTLQQFRAPVPTHAFTAADALTSLCSRCKKAITVKVEKSDIVHFSRIKILCCSVYSPIPVFI